MRDDATYRWRRRKAARAFMGRLRAQGEATHWRLAWAAILATPTIYAGARPRAEPL